MTEPGPGFPQNLNGAEILYRVLGKKKECRDHTFAFLIRESEKNSGLSVAYNCTPEEAEAPFNSWGILSLVAGDVSALGHPVVPDAPTHANITNIPYKEDNETAAFHIAENLSRICNPVVLRASEKKRQNP